MRWFLTVLGVIFGIAVFMFLDYALPSRQTVRISDAYNRLTDIGGNAIFYASPDTGTVQNAQHMAHLRPRTGMVQRVLTHSLQVAPAPTQCNMVQDVFGNTRTFFSLPFTHEQLRVRAESLLGQTDPVALRARLSGLLIGQELTATRPLWHGHEIVVVASTGLEALYLAALERSGARARTLSATKATLAGLALARPTERT